MEGSFIKIRSCTLESFTRLYNQRASTRCSLRRIFHEHLLKYFMINYSFVKTAGFNKVFPMEKLFPFSPSELQMILCGDPGSRVDAWRYPQLPEPKLGYGKERYGPMSFDCSNKYVLILCFLNKKINLLPLSSVKVVAIKSFVGFFWGLAKLYIFRNFRALLLRKTNVGIFSDHYRTAILEFQNGPPF